MQCYPDRTHKEKPMGLMFSRRGFVMGAALLAAGGILISVSAQQQPVVAIEGGTLIDGDGGPPLMNSVVLISGNRITAAGRAGVVSVPAGAHVIDARGKWVLPGLIDAKGNYAW